MFARAETETRVITSVSIGPRILRAITMVVTFMAFVLFLSHLVPSIQGWMIFFGRNPTVLPRAIELRAFSVGGEDAVVVELAELLRQRTGGVNARNAREEN